MENDDLLDWYLADLARQDEDLEHYLATRPDIPREVVDALQAAAWLERVPRQVPSPAFRARVHQRLAAAHRDEAGRVASRSSIVRRRVPSLRRIAVPLAAGLTLLFVVQGVFSASATALPETPLYPAKLAFEQLAVATAITPEQKARAHWAIAAVRLQEAATEVQAGHPDVAERLLGTYAHEVGVAQEAERAVPAVVKETLPNGTPEAATVQVVRQQIQASVSVTARGSAGGRSSPSPASTIRQPPGTQTGSGGHDQTPTGTPARPPTPASPTVTSSSVTSVATPGSATPNGSPTPVPGTGVPPMSSPPTPTLGPSDHDAHDDNANTVSDEHCRARDGDEHPYRNDGRAECLSNAERDANDPPTVMATPTVTDLPTATATPTNLRDDRQHANGDGHDHGDDDHEARSD
jgi:hypothetical protein